MRMFGGLYITVGVVQDLRFSYAVAGGWCLVRKLLNHSEWRELSSYCEYDGYCAGVGSCVMGICIRLWVWR